MLFVGQIYRHRRLVQLGLQFVDHVREHAHQAPSSARAATASIRRCGSNSSSWASRLFRSASLSIACGPPITMFSEMPLEILPDHGNVGHRNGLAVGAVEQHAGSRQPLARGASRISLIRTSMASAPAARALSIVCWRSGRCPRPSACPWDCLIVL
jgi:hypothetical protein